jgi:hypothetical protein
MATVSDVFAFAVQNADYWTEFLSGGDYPNELTEEEIRALSAARQHVDSLVVEILHATGAQFVVELGENRIAKKRFNEKNTAGNRAISLPAPSGLDGKLYGIKFSFGRNDDGAAIELYASLVVKKGSLDALRQALGERQVEHGIDGYLVYAPSIPLVVDTEVADLAKRSAKQAAALLSGFGS